jgi:outer membrane protein
MLYNLKFNLILFRLAKKIKYPVMKKFLLLIFTWLTISQVSVFSQQKVWSLEDCIKYAIDNNIQIKQQVVQTKVQKNALDLAKLNLLPTLNGSASNNFSFNRTFDQSSFQFSNKNGMSDQFYLGGSLNLFNGLQNSNTIKMNQYQLLASEQDLQTIKDNIALNVALDYLQVLLNKELVAATNNQLQITIQQIGKTKKLVDAGSVARGNLLQIESQAAQEEVQLINMKNQLDLSFLNLTQLLELKTPVGFEVIVPHISVDTTSIITGNIDDIFTLAQASRPEVKSSEMKLSASEYSLRTAQGGRSPRLSLSYSFNTAYVNTTQKLTGLDPETNLPIYAPYPFSSQVSDNSNYGIGFTLNIPILNGWQVNKNISNSKLNIENSRYTLEGTKKQLYKTIQQAYTDAVAALKKYNASLKAVTSTEESFRYTEQKFNVGMVTSVDYNVAKTQLLNAQSDLSQAKYDYIFKTKVLDFYKGLPLNLDNLNK